MKIQKDERPQLDGEDVKAILRSYYALEGDLKELPSERDQNFYLKCKKGDFVLKIANKMEKRENLDFQNQVVLYLEGKELGGKIPKLIKTTNDKFMDTYNKDGDNHYVRMLEYIPGKMLANATHHPDLMYTLGSYLGRLDSSLTEFEHEAMYKEFHWDLLEASQVIQSTIHLIPEEKQEVIRHFLNLFEQLDLNDFRKSVIHNDANDYNIVVDGSGIGLIDFGDMIYTCTVFELAIAVAYAMLEKKDPLDTAGHIIQGYNQENPLTQNEIDSLFVLSATRLCVSVCMSVHQKKQEPENKYLQISEKPAWSALEQLYRINPKFASYYFRWICGFELVDPFNTSMFSTKIKPVLGFQLSIKNTDFVDLSIGSTDLGLIRDNADGKYLMGLITQKLQNTGKKVLIGRYDETRLQYIHSNFAIETNNGLEWRATHIGIDLFVREGCPVYAPLDGILHSFADNSGEFDYGPTIILEHNINGSQFYTLYGHLSKESLDDLSQGKEFKAGQKIGEVGAFNINGQWSPHLHFQIIRDMMGYIGTFPGVTRYRHRGIWSYLCPDPSEILGIPLKFPRKEIGMDDILKIRDEKLGRSLSISYHQPLKILRGHMQYLYDHTGRRYLDAVNNVPHVGHNHPEVVKALVEQANVLNTNTRYLHDHIITYAKMLTATLPDPLEVCFFVNSGSEANELAIRLARTYTGNDHLLVLDCAYHGNTNMLINISPYKFDGPGGSGAPDFVHKVKTPDIFRGEYKGKDAGKKYALQHKEIIQGLEKRGEGIAGFICESLPGVGGQIVLPENYFAHAFEYVRSAGGVCIADEVQVGFGRVGKYFWGFEQQGVVPDIVVMGKPIGNGHPMAAVVTTRKIADAFNNGMEFFSTTGGNPVSCAVGIAVLEVIEREQLQEHAKNVGEYFLSKLRQIGNKFSLVGDVRGMGLFIGIELVLDNKLSPAAEHATYITNRMRDHGILISTDGPLHNVLKIKPPLAFSRKNADFLANTLEQILNEDFCQIS